MVAPNEATPDRDDELVVFEEFAYEPQATFVAESLKAAGIPVRIENHLLAGFRGTEIPVYPRVMVFRSDLERARQHCADLKAIDWSEVDVGEPADEVADEGRA